MPPHRPAHRAPLPPGWDHNEFSERLWERFAPITTPLRDLGLYCEIDFGLSDYHVRVHLSDGSYVVIAPPQEPPEEGWEIGVRGPSYWVAYRQHDSRDVYELIYSSDPDEPTHHLQAAAGGRPGPLLNVVSGRLDTLGLLPARPPLSTADREVLLTLKDSLRGQLEYFGYLPRLIPVPSLQGELPEPGEIIELCAAAAGMAHKLADIPTRQIGLPPEAPRAGTVRAQVDQAIADAAEPAALATMHLSQAAAQLTYLHHGTEPTTAAASSRRLDRVTQQLDAARTQTFLVGLALQQALERLDRTLAPPEPASRARPAQLAFTPAPRAAQPPPGIPGAAGHSR
ncbi:hypothetical protein ACIBK8_25730 [Streptomyces sp. NPDC050161]|uniref:hypothetical protein n=1 Tax=Streptomyces sp. NPDC050161 TaxID=3365604 RepID=UPI0037A5B9B5